MRPSDYDVFPEGCSLNSESYLAAQTAVRVTEVESLPCINQKPAPEARCFWTVIVEYNTSLINPRLQYTAKANVLLAPVLDADWTQFWKF